jgi:hypothetical protein
VRGPPASGRGSRHCYRWLTGPLTKSRHATRSAPSFNWTGPTLSLLMVPAGRNLAHRVPIGGAERGAGRARAGRERSEEHHDARVGAAFREDVASALGDARLIGSAAGALPFHDGIGPTDGLRGAPVRLIDVKPIARGRRRG